MERSAAARRADPETVASAVRQTREYQRLTTKCWPRQAPDALVGGAVQEPPPARARSAGDLLAPEELDLLLALQAAAEDRAR